MRQVGGDTEGTAQAARDGATRRADEGGKRADLGYVGDDAEGIGDRVVCRRGFWQRVPDRRGYSRDVDKRCNLNAAHTERRLKPFRAEVLLDEVAAIDLPLELFADVVALVDCVILFRLADVLGIPALEPVADRSPAVGFLPVLPADAARLVGLAGADADHILIASEGIGRLRLPAVHLRRAVGRAAPALERREAAVRRGRTVDDLHEIEVDRAAGVCGQRLVLMVVPARDQ